MLLAVLGGPFQLAGFGNFCPTRRVKPPVPMSDVLNLALLIPQLPLPLHPHLLVLASISMATLLLKNREDI